MYMTFLLVNSKWQDTEAVLSFIDHLIQTVSPQGKLQLTAELKDHATNRPSRISGDFYSLRNKLRQHLVDSISIGSMEWRPDRAAEFYLFFEGVRKVVVPATKRILTFSIGEKNWKLAANEGRRDQILSLVEQFFETTDSFYGFGHNRETIISGPFDVLNPVPNAPIRRVIDREWDTVTDIYKYNYLTSALVNQIKDVDSLCSIDGVMCKTLVDSANAKRGLAIYLQADEPSVLSSIAAKCLGLIDSADA